jgi:hypothetical protein
VLFFYSERIRRWYTVITHGNDYDKLGGSSVVDKLCTYFREASYD